MPDPGSYGVAFFVLFSLFFQLRVSDEFKDAVDDALYRPERAVPRGLVSLKELAFLAFFAGLAQAGLVLLFAPGLLLFLVPVWVYMGLMGKEFFVPGYLRRRLLLYMVSHMLIMPLIDLFATSTVWFVYESFHLPSGLVWFLVLSFFNGMILELGRKTWAPSMERPGVESYSSTWGIGNSIMGWLFVLLMSFLSIVILSFYTDSTLLLLSVMGPLFFLSVFISRNFLDKKNEKAAKALENISGVWVLFSYIMGGIVPLLAHRFSGV